MPPSDASRVTVRLLTGIGAGVYFDVSALSFQVPIELSAPSAPIVVIARAISVLVRIVRICQPPLNYCGHRCLRSNGAQTPTPFWHRWWGTRNTLIAPNSIPVDQPWERSYHDWRLEEGLVEGYLFGSVVAGPMQSGALPCNAVVGSPRGGYWVSQSSPPDLRKRTSGRLLPGAGRSKGEPSGRLPVPAPRSWQLPVKKP